MHYHWTVPDTRLPGVPLSPARILVALAGLSVTVTPIWVVCRAFSSIRFILMAPSSRLNSV